MCMCVCVRMQSRQNTVNTPSLHADDQHLSAEEILTHYPDFVGFPKPVQIMKPTFTDKDPRNHEEL